MRGKVSRVTKNRLLALVGSVLVFLGASSGEPIILVLSGIMLAIIISAIR